MYQQDSLCQKGQSGAVWTLHASSLFNDLDKEGERDEAVLKAFKSVNDAGRTWQQDRQCIPVAIEHKIFP